MTAYGTFCSSVDSPTIAVKKSSMLARVARRLPDSGWHVHPFLSQFANIRRARFTDHSFYPIPNSTGIKKQIGCYVFGLSSAS